MDKLIIEGDKELSGTVEVSSAKNAILPILAATLLTKKEIVFEKLPELRDVNTMLKLLEQLGASVSSDGEFDRVRADNIDELKAPYELVKTMRASILVLGPLLARFGECQVSLPGGCAIGTRPIDIHLTALEQMGAEIDISGGYVTAKAKKLVGSDITFNFPSVGATENLMMAAALAQGKTTLINAAREPEIVELARFLECLGVQIEGAGESNIVIWGREHLDDSTHASPFKVMGDRIEACTYIISALMTHSHLTIKGFNPLDIQAVIDVLQRAGANFIIDENKIEVLKISAIQPFEIETMPYPGIPTDVQAQLLALATQAKGTSIIAEKIFENRFMHVPELCRLGANIKINQNTAIVKGPIKFQGAELMCTDLRASAALVLGALCAEGTSTVQRVYHLDRGYEQLDQKLAAVGASIRREG